MLPLTDDIAATLQARLSWPQADGCAADVVNMFSRRMRDFPLTCKYCQAAPATALLVADLSVGRQMALVCQPCGRLNIREATVIAKSRTSAWLFTLIPAYLGENTDA